MNLSFPKAIPTFRLKYRTSGICYYEAGKTWRGTSRELAAGDMAECRGAQERKFHLTANDIQVTQKYTISPYFVIQDAASPSLVLVCH
jgi:hypothetical protein